LLQQMARCVSFNRGGSRRRAFAESYRVKRLLSASAWLQTCTACTVCDSHRRHLHRAVNRAAGWRQRSGDRLLGSRRHPVAALPSAVQTCRSPSAVQTCRSPCGAKSSSCSSLERGPEAAAPPRAAFAGVDGSAVPHAPGPWWRCVVSAFLLLCIALEYLKIASIWRACSNPRRRGPAVPIQR
jgi:hypothetical protein